MNDEPKPFIWPKDWHDLPADGRTMLRINAELFYKGDLDAAYAGAQETDRKYPDKILTQDAEPSARVQLTTHKK
jgi:hypothetical protein